jgi:hypothetical protein
MREYPRCKYHLVKEVVVVNSQADEDDLGSEWSDLPLQSQDSVIEPVALEEIPGKRVYNKKAKP